MDELDRVGAEYLRRMTPADLRALLHADGVSIAEEQRRRSAIERQPALILDILDRPVTSSELLNLATAAAPQRERFTFVSPFLVFAAALHRTAADLAGTSYVPDRSGSRLRVPVFDAATLSAYLAPPRRRLFLADLLTSFARVTGGVAVVRTPRGPRRRRWSELDPVRLAVLLDAVPEHERASVWRRLGDLALFLTGVFPDHAARLGPGRLDAERLARLTRVTERPDIDTGPDELYEWFGSRWYGLANEAAAHTATPSMTREPAVTAGSPADSAAHFHEARRVLNAVADRYLFPVTADWFGARGSRGFGTAHS